MAKFRSFAAFAPPSRYELLPFNFDRFDADTYILSNLVGQYHLLDTSKFYALLDHTLPSSDPDFAALRAKHFLRSPGDEAALELLALKLRTRLSHLPLFTGLHIFVVTLRCDHSCGYCQVSRRSPDTHAYDMTLEIAERALDFTFRSPNPSIKIEFQGGEPLLNFALIRDIVLRAEQRNLEEKRDLAFVIATTLSLLDDEILDFCREHRILLSCSLDGPPDLHNTNRPRPGRDSYQRFVAGLERARAAVGYDQVSALMTTTSRSLGRVRDIIDEYLRLGFNGIFLRALSPYGFARKTRQFSDYDVTQWLAFYKEGLEYILELNKAGVDFTEHFTAVVLRKILCESDPGFVDLMSPAGIGIAAIVYNYDGAVYASDESRMLAEMGDFRFRLGSLLHDSYEDVMLSDPLLDTLEDTFPQSVPMCSDCAYQPYCGADPVYHHALYGDVVGRKPESGFCQRNMAVFTHLIQLMRDDPAAGTIFLRWANRC